MKVIAIYKGDRLLCFGTRQQCADYLKIKPSTISFYKSPSYQNRVKQRGKSKQAIKVIEFEE